MVPLRLRRGKEDEEVSLRYVFAKMPKIFGKTRVSKILTVWSINNENINTEEV